MSRQTATSPVAPSAVAPPEGTVAPGRTEVVAPPRRSRPVRERNGLACLFAIFATVLWGGMAFESFAEEGLGGRVVLATLFSLMFLMGAFGAGRDWWRGRSRATS
jgi:hypothetical protein